MSITAKTIYTRLSSIPQLMLVDAKIKARELIIPMGLHNNPSICALSDPNIVAGPKSVPIVWIQHQPYMSHGMLSHSQMKFTQNPEFGNYGNGGRRDQNQVYVAPSLSGWYYVLKVINLSDVEVALVKRIIFDEVDSCISESFNDIIEVPTTNIWTVEDIEIHTHLLSIIKCSDKEE